MDPIERAFAAYWIKEQQYDQMQQIGRMLGVMFSAGEVRGWRAAGEGGEGYDDEDSVLVPMTFMLRPESRDGVQKMVGSEGLALPKGYKKRDGELIVDLGKVSPEEFKAFVDKNRVNSLKG